MKLRKIMAGIAAAAVASSSLAVAASAALVVPENTDPACIPGTGMWLVQVYNVGNEAENKPATDRGIDLTKVTGVRFTVEIDLDNEELGGMGLDFFEGAIGGAVVLSINGGDIVQFEDPSDPFATESEVWSTYNWASQGYWGCDFVNAAGEAVSTNPNTSTEDTADDNPISAKDLGNYKYELEYNGFANPFTNTEDAWEIDEIGCMQVALQDWGTDLVPMEVLSCEILDADGNVLLAFDGLGNETAKVPAGETPDAPEAPETPETPDAPEAPEAPGASSKPNAGTGAEGLALVAGIAVVATGAIVVAKKRS